MPVDAVSWIDRMIQYTVAGGKLNRGLATVAVMRTLTEAAGQSLTPKVCYRYNFHFKIKK
jgi:hypothetical protein